MAYTITIGTKGDTSGVDKVTNSLKKADSAADDFINSIKAGVGIDIGGKLVNSIASIPGMLQNAISKGLEFNATMDNSEVGIANVLGKFMDLDAQAAKAEAAKAIQKIIELEPKAAGGLSDLVLGFMSTVSAAQSIGISVEDNIDLVGKFANALANSSQPIEQLGQEMRSILTGNITADSAIAKTLQISNADIEKAKAAGNVVEFLNQKLGNLGQAGDSAAVRMSSFASAVEKSLGKLTKPIFAEWMKSLEDLGNAADKAGGSDGIKLLGYQLAELVRTGASFTQMLTQHSGLIVGVTKGVGALAAAWASYQIAALVVGLNRKAAAIFSNKVALEAETVALAKHTAAQVADNAASAAAPVQLAENATSANAPSKKGGGFLANMKKSWQASNIAGAASTGIGIGLIGYDLLTSKAAQMNAESDRTKEIGNAISDVSAKYSAAIKSAASVADKQEIIKGLETDIKKLREMSGDASEYDADMLERSAGLLERMLGTAKGLSEEKLKQKEAATAQKDAETKAAAALEENQKVIAEETARRRNAARDNTARGKLDEATSLMDKGDIPGAKASLDGQEKYFRDWKDQAEKKIDPSNPDKEKLKADYDLVQQIQGYLDEIAAARKELPKAIEEAEKKATETQVKALEEKRDLEEAEGKKRLAELDAQTKKGQDNSKARLAIENEIAQKRLDFESQIGQLQNETAIARQTREINSVAERIARENSAAAAAQSDAANLATGKSDPGEGRINTSTGISKKYGVRGAEYDAYGNLTGGSRGGVPIAGTDLAAINSAEGRGGSPLDRFKNSQPGMPGYQPIVPATTVPPVASPSNQAAEAGGAGGSNPAVESVNKLGDSLKEFEEVAKALDKVSDEVSGIQSSALGSANELARKVRQLRADVDAIKRTMT